MRYINTLILSLCIALGYAQQPSDLSLNTSINYPADHWMQLNWNKSTTASSYQIFKKNTILNTWTLVSTLSAMDSTILLEIDANATTEIRLSSTGTISTNNYFLVGSKVKPKHRQGSMLLLIDENYRSPLSNEIATLTQDLIGDGWLPLTKYYKRSDKPSDIKKDITLTYLSLYPDLKGIFLLGRIPVPYSGFVAPDGHPDHRGAWPADGYYGDTTSIYWKDNAINTTVASRIENHNLPFDQKFDPSFLPNSQMFVGRVDLTNMPAFGISDTLLVKRYLQRDHNFRNGLLQFENRALVDDNFGYFGGEAFSQNGWRNFKTLIGNELTSSKDYFSSLKNGSSIWSYGCGGGWYQGASGVGSSTDFNNDSIQCAFTMLFGSYFGDWDSQNNFLRAPLACPSPILVNFWAGRPNWFLHKLAKGEPFGTVILDNMNNANTYQPLGSSAKGVHMAFMGDPTLKMHPIKSPLKFEADTTSQNGKVHLSWSESEEPNHNGYYLYKTDDLAKSFSLISQEPFIGNVFIDDNPYIGRSFYMIRTSKLVSNPSGSFYQLSCGAIDSVVVSKSTTNHEILNNESWNTYPNPVESFLHIEGQIDSPFVVTIYNSKGDLFFHSKYAEKNVKISTIDFLPGLYILHINSDAQSGVYRFLKKP